jgi:tetratricopeptide (TPR) repeat protein
VVGWRRRVLGIFLVLGIVTASAVVYLIERSPRTPWGSRSAFFSDSRGNSLQNELAKANYFYWLHNFSKALPLYERAEKLTIQTHDDRDALYAKIGLMRSEDRVPFPALSAFLKAQLNTPLVQSHPERRLWCLGVKGDADDEVNAGAAKRDWEQVQRLARRLGQKEWVNRATGELGLVAFLQGDVKRATHMIGQALLTAIAQGDTGTEVRHLETVGNGFNALYRFSEAMFFFNHAISIANKDHDMGTPFMAYEGKAEALAKMGDMAQAQSLIEQTLAKARKEGMLEHESQELLILGEFATWNHQDVQAKQYLEEAIQSSTQMGPPRVVMNSCFMLSNLLQNEGDLKGAEAALSQGLAISRSDGDTFFLPFALDALAGLDARTGQSEHPRTLRRGNQVVRN